MSDKRILLGAVVAVLSSSTNPAVAFTGPSTAASPTAMIRSRAPVRALSQDIPSALTTAQSRSAALFSPQQTHSGLFATASSGDVKGGGGRDDASGDGGGINNEQPKGLRGKLRQMTGFSMTAFRATLRGITGFSLTALRASVRAATGVSVTATMRTIVGLFPLWFRYFMQPFLVLYYAPLMLVRSWVGETKTSRAEQLAAHEKLVEGWKHAIEVAEHAQSSGYWPLHIDDEGNIVAQKPPEPEDVWSPPSLNDAVLESVGVADAIENE